MDRTQLCMYKRVALPTLGQKEKREKKNLDRKIGHQGVRRVGKFSLQAHKKPINPSDPFSSFGISSSWTMKICSSHHHLLHYEIVYDRNHYLGFGPILKPKPKLADTFGRYRNPYQNYILKGRIQLPNEDFFSIIKEPLKPNCLPNIRYFQIILQGLGLFSSL